MSTEPVSCPAVLVAAPASGQGKTTVAAALFGDDRSRPWASAGVGTKLGRGLSINASVAVQFENPRVTQWTLGAKIEF